MAGGPRGNTFLEEFVRGLGDVPSDLYGVFALITELDSKCAASSEEFDKSAKTQFALLRKQLQKGDSEGSQALEVINTKYKECLKLSKEKIDLANRAYDVVDNHIRKLDDYLQRFEGELILSGKDPNSKEVVKEEESREMDMPVDPNEPTYCVCKRVSYGEMVACDNTECEVEWFHFECVGLKKQPKGRWYCKECTEKLKRRKLN
eukprot:c33051_g1_i1.p1 GENE.c33051_g1_i1~~c33051_g1_i1.p1  ORF type:complete len:205 (-),score=50.22 c33051_g1_i1:123-737(-)